MNSYFKAKHSICLLFFGAILIMSYSESSIIDLACFLSGVLCLFTFHQVVKIEIKQEGKE